MNSSTTVDVYRATTAGAHRVPNAVGNKVYSKLPVKSLQPADLHQIPSDMQAQLYTSYMLYIQKSAVSRGVLPDIRMEDTIVDRGDPTLPRYHVQGIKIYHKHHLEVYALRTAGAGAGTT